MNKVYIDGADLNVDAFSSWNLQELNWPDLQIPKGIVAESANQLTPLSFRNTLRHIYRNEDSWTDFANKEAEFIRRAVVSQLLGFARVKYSNKDFHIAQARKRLAEAQAVEREVQESTLQAVTAISDRLNIPVARSLEQVAAARDAVRAELDAAYEQRRQLTADINSVIHGGHETTGAGYDTTLTADYENTSRRLQRALDEVTALEQLHDEHKQSAQTVTERSAVCSASSLPLISSTPCLSGSAPPANKVSIHAVPMTTTPATSATSPSATTNADAAPKLKSAPWNQNWQTCKTSSSAQLAICKPPTNAALTWNSNKPNWPSASTTNELPNWPPSWQRWRTSPETSRSWNRR
jgi:hypothetical protein